MENHRSILIVLGVVVACLMVSNSAPAEVVDFAEYVPGDFLFYAGFPYSEENVAKMKESSGYKLMESDEYKKMIETFMESIPMDDDATELFKKAGFSWEDLFALKHGGVGLAFNAAMEQGNPPKMDAVVFFDTSNGEIKELTIKVRKLLDIACEEEDADLKKELVEVSGIKAAFYKPTEEPKPMEPEGLLLFEKGDLTVITLSKASAQKVIGYMNAKGEDTLAKNDLYIKTMAKLGENRMEEMFVNMKEIFARFGGMMAQDADSAKVFKMLELESLQAIGASSRLDKNGTAAQLYFHCPDGKFLLLKPFQNGRASFNTLNGVNKKALAFISISLDPVQIYDDILMKMLTVDENAHKQFMEGMKEFEEGLGLKLRDDLLASLGGEVTLVMPSALMDPEAKSMPLPVALLIELKNKDKIEKAYKKFLEVEGIKLNAKKYGAAGHEIQELPQAVVCMTDKYWIVSNSVRTVEDILDNLDNTGAGITGTEQYKNAMKMIGEEAAFLFFLNHKEMNNIMENMDKWTQMFMGGKGQETPEEPEEELDSDDMDMEAEIEAEDEELEKELEEYEEQQEKVREALEGMKEGPESPQMDPMEQMKEFAKFWKLFSEYYPAMYFSMGADKEGLMIKFVWP